MEIGHSLFIQIIDSVLNVIPEKAKVSSEMMSHWTKMSIDPVMYKDAEYFQVNKKMSKGKQCASLYFVTSS